MDLRETLGIDTYVNDEWDDPNPGIILDICDTGRYYHGRALTSQEARALAAELIDRADYFDRITKGPDMSDYKDTHASVHDGSPAMMIGETNGFIVLENEDGYTWTSPVSDWRPIDMKDSTMTTTIPTTQLEAAVIFAQANRAQGDSRAEAFAHLSVLLGGASDLVDAAVRVAYGSSDFDAEDALDTIFAIGMDHAGTDIGGPYFSTGFRDKVRMVLADVFAAGIAEGQDSADFAFNDGDVHFSDTTNPFRKD